MKQYKITKIFECRAGIGAEFESDGKTEALKFTIPIWTDEGLKKPSDRAGSLPRLHRRTYAANNCGAKRLRIGVNTYGNQEL